MKKYITITCAFFFAVIAFSLNYSLTAEEKKAPFDEVFKKLDAQVRATLKKDQTEGLKELERVGNLLAKEYPEEFMPYAMLNAVARMTTDQEKKVLKFSSVCLLWMIPIQK